MINFFLSKFPFAIISLFLLNSISSCSKTKHIDTAEEKERTMVLKHKIKTITEYRTSVLLGIKQPEQFSQVKHFDDNGLLITETDYKQDGNIDCMLSYVYDKNGNSVIISAINPDSSFLFRQTKNYDENNNMKELYFFLPDGTYKYRNIAIYDDEGRMMELAWYWSTGFKSRNKFEYDGRKKISHTEYDGKGNHRYKWVYRYDKKENLIEAIQYAPSGAINRKIIYEFNEKNQLAKETSYMGEDIQNSNSFLYDQKDLLLSKTEFSSFGKIITLFRYQYEYR